MTQELATQIKEAVGAVEAAMIPGDSRAAFARLSECKELLWTRVDEIVRAVNSHDALVKALEAILANHETVGAGASIFQCTTAEVKAARSALSAASNREGEK